MFVICHCFHNGSKVVKAHLNGVPVTLKSFFALICVWQQHLDSTAQQATVQVAMQSGGHNP